MGAWLDERVSGTSDKESGADALTPPATPARGIDPAAPTSLIRAVMGDATVAAGDHMTSHASGVSAAETVIYASRAAEGDLRGHRIGNYRIEDRIGGGGMGVVYLARQDNPRRQVAIKLMRQGITSRSARARFHQEAELLARLAHPAVAQIYEAGMHLPPDAAGPDQAMPFFAMEYVRNAKPLTNYAASHHLSLQDRVRLFVEVCRGVEHGHQQGVIHRDLKPANILVNEAGQPKIIDYGVAVCIDPADASPRHTETGQIIGTIQYMSPEQLAGSGGKLDPRADIYSLGVVLYELICRRLPYDVDGRSFVDATRVILDQAPTSPRQHVGSIDDDLETVILHALDKDRHTRFQSVGELVKQCEKYLRGEPLDIKPISRLTKTWRRSMDVASRRLEWATLAIVAVVTIVAGETIDGFLHRQTNVNEWMFDTTLGYASRYASGVPLTGVKMISVTPGTDVAGIAAGLGLPEADFDQLYTVRPLYGALLQRMAALPTRPLAVLLDVRFTAERPGYDEALAEGIRRLGTFDGTKVPPRVDVICALGSLQPTSEGRPAISAPLVEAGVKFGDPMLHVAAAGVPWIHPKVDLAIKNPQSAPIPGLALRTYMSARYPGCELLIEKNTQQSSLLVVAHDPALAPGAGLASGLGRKRGSEEISYLSTAPREETASMGIDPEAMIPIYETRLAPEEHLRSKDRDLGDALGMSDEQMAREYGGQVLVVGVREIPAETNELAGGRTAAGMEVHASAIASLMLGFNVAQGEWLTLPMFGVAGVIWSALSALVGVLIGAVCARRPGRRWVLIFIAFACLVCANFASMRYADRYFNPIPCLISVILAAELAALLYRARLIRREHQPWRFA